MATMTISYNARSSRARKAISNLLATGLFTTDKKPNKLTMAAIEEAKTAENLPQVDTSSVESFIKSVMQ